MGTWCTVIGRPFQAWGWHESRPGREVRKGFEGSSEAGIVRMKSVRSNRIRDKSRYIAELSLFTN